MGVGRIRSIRHAFAHPPRLMSCVGVAAWVCGCLAPLHIHIHLTSVYIYVAWPHRVVKYILCDITSPLLMAQIVPYVFYMRSYYVRIVTLMLHLYHFDGPT